MNSEWTIQWALPSFAISIWELSWGIRSYQHHIFHTLTLMMQAEICTGMSLLPSSRVTPSKSQNKFIPWNSEPHHKTKCLERCSNRRLKRNEEQSFHSLNSSPNIITAIKSRSYTLTGHVTCMEWWIITRWHFWKPEENWPFWRHGVNIRYI
jgi:hypothetical protein